MTDYAADHLALKGKSERFILKGITDAENVIMSRKVTARVSSMDGEFSHILKRVRVLPTITEDAKLLIGGHCCQTVTSAQLHRHQALRKALRHR